MQIKVQITFYGGFCEESPEEIIEVPDNATDEEIEKLAEAAAMDHVNVSWRRWPPPPPHHHASIERKRLLTNEAPIVDICECGAWKVLGTNHWRCPPLPRVIQ